MRDVDQGRVDSGLSEPGRIPPKAQAVCVSEASATHTVVNQSSDESSLL